MLEKNRQKKERAARRQTFVGVRPARFKKKTVYDRKAQKNDTRAQINGDQSQPPRNGRFNFALSQAWLTYPGKLVSTNF